jgi:sirohydrochlorin cobaltochelatase
MTTKTANILLAHGSRDPQWQEPFIKMCQAIKQQADNNNDATIVELAYMELCEPSLENMCANLAQQGITHLNIYPVFFAAGRHLRIDVPQQLAEIEKELNVTTQLHPPIGQEKVVQDAITRVILNKL